MQNFEAADICKAFLLWSHSIQIVATFRNTQYNLSFLLYYWLSHLQFMLSEILGFKSFSHCCLRGLSLWILGQGQGSKGNEMPLQGKNLRCPSSDLLQTTAESRNDWDQFYVRLAVPLYVFYWCLTVSFNPSIYSSVIKQSCCIHSFPSLQPAEEKNAGQFSWHMTPNMSCHYRWASENILQFSCPSTGT